MLPSLYASKIAQEYSNKVNAIHRKAMGQFFTVPTVSRFMAECISINKQKVKILDPGFGTGVLSCALVEYLVEENNIKDIEIVGYENDSNLLELSNLAMIYLRNWLSEKNINLKYILYPNDFITSNSQWLSTQNKIFDNEERALFDIVISNPPYFKLSIDDERAKLAKDIINGHPNIYAIFMYLSVRLLKEGGEFVFIVPRSFASGQYFKLFRNKFFELIKLEHIHLFKSRKKYLITKISYRKM